MFFSSIGNRWKGIASSQLRYDDEVYGPEVGSSFENLQFSESRRSTQTLILQIYLFNFPRTQQLFGKSRRYFRKRKVRRIVAYSPV